jgi:hypothetical protein
MSKRLVCSLSLAACPLLAAVVFFNDSAFAAPGSDHWSFQPVTRPAPPAVANADRARNPIDLFILAELEKRGLRPSPPADRRTLIRRMHLVMHGLPATPEQLRTFIESDDPRAYERLVEDVLASPRYGERWGRHWLDVVRYADTNGFETNTPRPNAWRYRDWVIAAFNEDKPYDRFVTEQLAGDAQASGGTSGGGEATGFLVAGAYDVVKSPDVNLTLMQRQDELADMVNATSTAFLGLTVACARCHDHKFDAISQKDYYAMQAVFAGVQHGDRPVQTAESASRLAEAEQLKQRVAALRGELNSLESKVQSSVKRSPDAGHTIMIDDEAVLAEGASAGSAGVMLLAAKRGHGENPAGASRGFKDDPGDFDRLPNVSGGRYTFWEGVPNADLLAYRPGAAGRFRVWLSWGCGWDTHATDVKYVLDRDGDPATRGDQRVIAEVDQHMPRPSARVGHRRKQRPRRNKNNPRLAG